MWGAGDGVDEAPCGEEQEYEDADEGFEDGIAEGGGECAEGGTESGGAGA